MNRDQLQRVVERIEAHPDDLNMFTWAPVRNECGTACCIAGHTMLANGYEPTYDENEFVKDGKTTGGDTRYIAAKILGLDHDQMDELFYAFNVAPEGVRDLVDDLLRAEGQEPLPVKETSA